MIPKGTICNMHVRLLPFWILCCAVVVCMLASTSGVNAQTVINSGGLVPEGPPGGFGIDGDMLANKPADSLKFNNASDWFDSTGGIGVGVLNNDGTARDPNSSIFAPGQVLTIANQNDLFNTNSDDSWGGGIKINDTAHFRSAGLVTHNNNNKSEINHAYVMVTKDPGTQHFWLTVGADRQSNNGTDFIAVYLLQNKLIFPPSVPGPIIATGPDKGFTKGDFLFSVGFANGGVKPTIVVFQWSDSGGTLDFHPLNKFLGNAVFVSENLSGALKLPTGYTVFNGLTSYQQFTFVEFGADITALLDSSATKCGVFTQAVPLTVTSQTSGAQPKDFVAPVNVDIPISPEVVCATTPVSCFGTCDGTFTATGTGGHPPYQFSLNGGPYQSSNVFTGLCAGSYIVTIRDTNGCVGPPDTCAVGTPPALTMSLTK